MIDVALCITQDHDLRLVALAVLVCLIGSATTAQLFGRIRASSGRRRAGWVVLSAVATGTMVWCTHFVAMMGFQPHLPVTLDPLLTLASLLVSILLAAPGLALAAARRRWWALPGGAIVGLAISAMHYVGMAAYHLSGIVEWRWAYVGGSVAMSCLLSAAACCSFRAPRLGRRVAGGLLLAAAVASLHFTGMTAMRVYLLAEPAGGLSETAQMTLGIATACAGLLFVGCAAVSALIDNRAQAESFLRLHRMAMHDGLTDLPNRLSFHEDLNARLAALDAGSRLAVVMIDLSRFKVVNDVYGHHAGNELLVAIAARTQAMLRPGETVARLGGDEFAALVSNAGPAALDDFLARLRAVFAEPFTFDRLAASISANIGIAVAPTDGQVPDQLLARADLAMYRAKSSHSTLPCFYDAGMDEAVRERRELANDLRDAVAKGAFELHYQVQASLETGEISGYEVLTRWMHPTRGPIPPAYFIALAEEIGEIIPLSEWILRQACFEAALQPDRGIISVNLSPLHLSDPRLVETVRKTLEDTGLPPHRLTLELTESAIIHDRRYALQQLHALKAMGIAIALDDFGVGYSSLDVLRAFDFDCIKLDASFFAEIERDDHAVAILRSVAALGSTLRIPVLAEGVETPAQMRIAAREGCVAVQGFLIGKPSRDHADPATVRATLALPQPLDKAAA